MAQMVEKGVTFDRQSLWDILDGITVDYGHTITRFGEYIKTSQLPDSELQAMWASSSKHRMSTNNPCDDPDLSIDERQWFYRHAGAIKPRDQLIWLMRRHGYSYVEIAKHLGEGSDCARKAFNRLRSKINVRF